MIKPTMNLEKLRAEYQKMNVRFKDDFELKRALIYYGAVTDASQFFVADTAKQALDKTPGGYEKVKSALSSSQLLTGLCHLLDEPTIEIVNAELAQRKPYGTYFEELFKGYPNSIDTFLGKYSNLKKIFALIKQHFQDNILLACTRVLSDWPALEAMFLEEKGQKLEELTEITSTGSDFHKGGQQVLILTFRTNLVNKPLRIVYKPSDLEVDCLIMGKTEALTKAGLADFQTESLMEILWLMKPPADVPPDDFPRYKILPRNPGSQLQRDDKGRLPIRTSYGYLEFLDYDDAQRRLSAQNKDTLCTRFSTILGQLAAVACAFSLSDLHIENLIVHQYAPYLIDLENCLSRPIDQLSATEMTTGDVVNGGALDGVLLEENVPTVRQDTATQIELQVCYRPSKNRLWTDGTALISMAEYGQAAIAGFKNTMASLRLAHQQGRFDSWFTRLKKGAIVRIVPLGSNRLHDILISTFQGKLDVDTALRKKMGGELEAAYRQWAEGVAANQSAVSWKAAPRFVCLQAAYVIDDLLSYDVPVFYHQLHTCDVMDSQGVQIKIPESILINGKMEQVTNLLKRSTFFSQPPLKYIQETQVTSNTSSPQVDKLLKELEAALKLEDVKLYDNKVSQKLVVWEQ